MTALGLTEVSSDCHVANAQVAPFESKELSTQAMRPAILTDFYWQNVRHGRRVWLCQSEALQLFCT